MPTLRLTRSRHFYNLHIYMHNLLSGKNTSRFLGHRLNGKAEKQPFAERFFVAILGVPQGRDPPLGLKFLSIKTENSPLSFVPASIAFGHPNADLSGTFLKPLRDWDYPNNLPFVPQRRCLLVYVIHVSRSIQTEH